jgi:hypothetical protein
MIFKTLNPVVGVSLPFEVRASAMLLLQIAINKKNAAFQ